MGCGRTNAKLAEHTQPIVSIAALHQQANGTSRLYGDARGPILAKVDYIYGCSAIAKSLFYLVNADFVVYPCATVAVILTISSNMQRYLGGGEVHQGLGHHGKISALTVNRDRNRIATSDSGSSPTIHLWKPPETSLLTIALPSDVTTIEKLGFSSDSSLLASIDQLGDIRVFELQEGKVAFYAPGRPGRPVTLSWSPTNLSFCTAGKSHFAFWTATGTSYSRSQVTGSAELSVVFWSAIGCLGGGKDGKIYLWNDGVLTNSLKVLPAGCGVQSLISHEDSILVGGDDRCIHVLDSSLTEIKVIETPGIPLSLDMCPKGILCGTDEGVFMEIGRSGRVILMDAHMENRQIAISRAGSGLLVSVSGDNKVKSWHLNHRHCLVSGVIEVGLKPGAEAVSLSIGPQGHVAIGHFDGHFTVRQSANQLNSIIACKKDGSEPLTLLKYAPSGAYLVAMSTAGTLFFHNTKTGYALVRTVKTNSSEIVAADWDSSGVALRTQDKAGKIKYWEADTGEEQSEIVPQKWASDTFHRLSVTSPCAAARFEEVLAQGTTAGVLELSVPNKPLSAYRVHAGGVKEVVWEDAQTVLTVGEKDGCIVQWKVSSSE